MPDDDQRAFGRRGRSPSKPAAPIEAGFMLRGATTIVRSPLGKQLLGVLGGIAILFLLQAAYVASMKGFGRALDRHWAENAGYPGIEDAYRRGSQQDERLEQAHNHCKARSDFVTLDSSQRNALEGFDGLYSGETGLARAAAYLSCLIAYEPPRFCAPAHRAQLAAVLNDYYKLMRQVREERYLAASDPFAVKKSLLINPPRGGSPPAMVPPPSAQSDPRVLDGIRRLVTNGYLARRDLAGTFGGLPGDLDVALRGVEPLRNGCA
jgi:hypothetical protein